MENGADGSGADKGKAGYASRSLRAVDRETKTDMPDGDIGNNIDMRFEPDFVQSNQGQIPKSAAKKISYI